MSTIEQRIKFKLDGEAKVKNAFKSLAREQRDLIDEFRTGNRTYDETVTSLKEIARGYENAEQGARAYENALSSLNAEQRLANDTRANEDRFDTISRQVAFAGDVPSNLGALSGLAGAAGANSIEQGLGIGGELVALVEELPRLKEAVKGLQSAANAAGKALGLGGGAGLVGALGITAIAVAAVGIAFKTFSENAKAQANQIQAVIDATRDVRTDIAQGLTSTDASAKLAELNRLREVELSIITDTQTQYDQQITSQNALLEGILKFTAQEQVLVDTIKNGEATVTEYDTAIKLLTDAQDSGALSANDMKIAEEELANERSQAVLNQAAYQAEFLALQQESVDFDTEELASRKESLVLRKAQLEAELAFLQASGDVSDVVKQQIESLQGTIGNLSKDISFLDSSQAKSAAAANTARQAEESLAKSRQQSAQTTSNTASTERRSSSRRSSSRRSSGGGGFRVGGRSGGSSGGSSAEQRIRNKLAKDPNATFEDGSRLADSVLVNADSRRKREEFLSGATNDFAKSANAAGETLRDSILSINDGVRAGIEDLDIDQGRAIEDAVRTGNILAIRDVARNTARAAEDLNRQAGRDRLNAEIDYSNQLMKLHQDRNQLVLQSVENLTNQMVSKFNQATQSIGGSSGTRRFSFASNARS